MNVSLTAVVSMRGFFSWNTYPNHPRRLERMAQTPQKVSQFMMYGPRFLGRIQTRTDNA
jgi:hypothetical protein